MRDQRGFALRGWLLVALTAVVVGTSVLVILLTTPDAVEAVRRIMRITARYAVAFFLLAFTASALFRFWPNPLTRWQRQNRRYLGVSFAVAHFTHLAAIGALSRVAPAELAAEADAITWIFGGLAYALIGAMTLTSFDRTAQMIGPRAWSWLHTVGSYYIWVIFANSYVSRALVDLAYLPIATALIVALLLRIAVRIARGRVQQQPAVAG